MTAPLNTVPVHVVLTVLATDSAGNIVEATPVRPSGVDDTNEIGNPVTPILAAEVATGAPVRFVGGDPKVTLNAAGKLITVAPITGVP